MHHWIEAATLSKNVSISTLRSSMLEIFSCYTVQETDGWYSTQDQGLMIWAMSQRPLTSSTSLSSERSFYADSRKCSASSATLCMCTFPWWQTQHQSDWHLQTTGAPTYAWGCAKVIWGTIDWTAWRHARRPLEWRPSCLDISPQHSRCMRDPGKNNHISVDERRGVGRWWCLGVDIPLNRSMSFSCYILIKWALMGHVSKCTNSKNLRAGRAWAEERWDPRLATSAKACSVGSHNACHGSCASTSLLVNVSQKFKALPSRLNSSKEYSMEWSPTDVWITLKTAPTTWRTPLAQKLLWF